MAPNQELLTLTRRFTNKPCFLMQRGVDLHLFNPEKRNRTNKPFQIGYVGRLTPEKNLRVLATLGKTLQTKFQTDFEIVVIGEGSEENWLRANVPNSRFTGVLRGEALAQAYANLDVFVFPSRTDTFGNVVLESLASGVPAVVTNLGGPKFLVESGITGFVSASDNEFIACVEKLLSTPLLLTRMRQAARKQAEQHSWEQVFESVWRVYAEGIALHRDLSSAQRQSASLLSSRVHGRSRPRWKES